ncbi:response regulator [Sinorhizobium sp. BG8]|uniref:response regulator transcription factor n=1 Tax=Sinorhizobium sp. BG8 TaxID=2613773 RepID=UPI00193E456E|nr:response regulator [Sinorhizobium sp. BG8]QRM55228.1 response regulator transcription factor [Sinorhizobium sp. BG8]
MLNSNAGMNPSIEPTVYVIDDNRSVRDSLLDLFTVTNMRAAAFASGTEFFETVDDADCPGCVVVDLQMPGETGLDVQSRLASLGSRMPVIFLTGHADVPSSVAALKAGATDFIMKPFVSQALLEAVDHAMQVNVERRQADAERDEVRTLADTLTPRETEVMFGVVSGLMNKQVAYQLGVCEMTVKIHRMSVMRKMKTRSLADLVRKVGKLRTD